MVTFAARLPDPQSDLAHETLKDPYLFDFLGLGDEARERDIENALIRHITRFLLELGAGFAFVGRQFKLDVGGDEFFIDLLFYHIRLKCYVVVELKATAFKPEHAGQLNFYLSAVDAQVKAPDDKPTIGLLLCKEKNRLVACNGQIGSAWARLARCSGVARRRHSIRYASSSRLAATRDTSPHPDSRFVRYRPLVAEYALSGIERPIGVANYELVRSLPEPLDTSLPSIEDIEAELQWELKPLESSNEKG